jgi:hypothetical protein
MRGHSRPKNGVASLACDPRIHQEQAADIKCGALLRMYSNTFEGMQKRDLAILRGLGKILAMLQCGN